MTSLPHPIVCLLLELLLDLLMSLLQNFPVLWWAFLPFVLLFLQSTGKLSMPIPNILQCHHQELELIIIYSIIPCHQVVFVPKKL